MIGRWHQPTKTAHANHMQLEQLHHILGASVHMIPSGPESNGLRALLEAGSVETFLTGLLFIQLHARGYKVTREFPVIGRVSADIAIKASPEIYIEAKQLHLKDGPKYVRNLVRDLARHAKVTALGVIYVIDETRSTSEVRFQTIWRCKSASAIWCRRFACPLSQRLWIMVSAVSQRRLTPTIPRTGRSRAVRLCGFTGRACLHVTR